MLHNRKRKSKGENFCLVNDWQSHERGCDNLISIPKCTFIRALGYCDLSVVSPGAKRVVTR
jgi:hypothetical protein